MWSLGSTGTLFNHSKSSEFSYNSQDTVQYSESDLSYSSKDTVEYSEIKILSLNEAGVLESRGRGRRERRERVRNKLNTPEWEETILPYDIVCVQETHFDAYDSLDVQGFKCLPLMTRNDAKAKSGGIAILVREYLYDSVKVLKNEGDLFYWFTLLNQFPYDIAFCCVYVAPEGGKYSNIQSFEL